MELAFPEIKAVRNPPKASPAASPLYTGAYIWTGRLSLSSISISESNPRSKSDLPSFGEDGGVVTNPIFLPYQLRLTLVRERSEAVDDRFSPSLSACSEDEGGPAGTFSTKWLVFEEFVMDGLGACPFPLGPTTLPGLLEGVPAWAM
jgi:hypothetical protein